MLNRLAFISILFLFTHCLKTQIIVSELLMENKAIEVAKINRAELIDFAKKHLGTTYRYAGFDPRGFDCSGFVSFVFNHFNIHTPRSSKEYKYLGTAQEPNDFKVGDILVFYSYRDHSQIGHVGIICEANGMKSKFIHSSSGKAYGVTISQLNSEHYSKRFYKCIDVINQK